MLIQLTSPRPVLNVVEHPQHIVLHTIRRTGVSKGGVLLNMNTNVEHGTRGTIVVEPYEVFPIEGEPGFEALEYYLPFDQIYGTNRTLYSEQSAMESWSKTPKTKGTQGTPDTVLALLGASGISVIAHSAYRMESTSYAERVFNFQLFFPVTGGGIVRVVGSDMDISNPTFEPKAPIGTKNYANLSLRQTFNRIHQIMPSDVEQRRQARIRSAEASMASEIKKLPAKTDE